MVRRMRVFRSIASALLAGALTTACGGFTPTPAPTIAPSNRGRPMPSGTGVFVAPSQAPTPVSSPAATGVAPTPSGVLPALDLPTLSVPAASLHTMPGNGGLVTWGSHVYAVDEPLRSGHASIVVTDLVTGTAFRTTIPLLAGETTVPPDGFADPATTVAVDDHWLVVVVWKRLGSTGGEVSTPCTGHEEQPLAWRVLVARVDPSSGRIVGGFRVLDRGVSSHRFTLPGQGEGCGGPRTPRVSLSGDQIAYTVEESDATAPFATRVEIRTLPSGLLRRSVERPDEVLFVKLSGGTLAFTETQDASTVTNPRWSVEWSTVVDQAPTVVVAGRQDPGYVAPPDIALDGNLLSWQLLRQRGSGLWVESLGSSPVQVVPARLTCWLGGVTDGWVVMGCYPTGYQASGVTPYQPVVWSAATGLRQLAGVPRVVASSPPAVGAGWLSIDGGTDIQPNGTLYGLSLHDLAP